MLKRIVGVFAVILVTSNFAIVNSYAAESSFKGIVDVRAVSVSGEKANQSYLVGDYGKFRYGEGSQLALDQLGLQYHLNWQNNWSLNVIANGFVDDYDTTFGVTEAYAQYKGLPNSAGWRMQAKVGLYYPHISLENVATAWSTPYTLTSSAINNWLGEEFRSTGINFKIEKLGRFSGSNQNFSFDIDLFRNNDTAGAMLTWHGWTVGSRQTLFGETLVLQDFPARDGMLAAQAGNSDPFLELDNRWGLNTNAQWHYGKDLKVSMGYYNNFAERGIVVNGQYTWTTSFLHGGVKYKFADGWELIGQFMQGNTLMTSPTLIKVVDNDFDSQFVMVRHFWNDHHLALRLERFAVDDLDQTVGDNNDETGSALALAYRYRLNRQTFIVAEYTMVSSDRPSRGYLSDADSYEPMTMQTGYYGNDYQKSIVDLTEHQYQIAVRYYF
ncbi:MAG: hypothetical protein HWE10_11680 [Gammaproteobacteria bacterium]|nr:hypothetical protein [Gammaproteobacteria bacterium]